jgi:Zn-dependent protease
VSLEFLAKIVVWFVPVVLSLTVHEWAHAASADALGDDTARRLGRKTLNPFAHIDAFGTVLVPLIQLLASGGVMFAWAKPVPVNPVRLTRRVSMRTGEMFVSAAGPVSNLLIALAAALSIGLGIRFGVAEGAPMEFFRSMFALNIGLAVFNLLPIPPLDGSRVLLGLLPSSTARAYERIFPYAPLLLIAVIAFGGSLVRWPMLLLYGWMAQLSAMVAG